MSNIIAKGLALSFLVVSVFTSANSELPDYYSEPGINPHRDYINQTDTEVVDPFTGKLQLHYTDAYIPGNGGLDIKIQRSYTSLDDSLPASINRSVWGVGWTMHFGRVVKANSLCENIDLNKSDDNPVFELPDGNRQTLVKPYITQGNSFFEIIDGTPISIDDNQYFNNNIPDYVTKDLWIGFCEIDQDGNSYFDLTSPSGVQYTLAKQIFSGGSYSWYVSRIEDPNGNYLNFIYHGDNELASSFNKYPLLDRIEASDNRVVNFRYTGLNANAIDNVRLHQIYSNGQYWTYNYISNESDSYQYKLMSVTRPDLSQWAYDYYLETDGVGRYSIRSIEQPYGGKTSYQYTQKDFSNDGHLTTAVRHKSYLPTSNVIPAEWFYTYTPGHETNLTGEYDKTEVSAPNGTTIYHHFGFQSAAALTDPLSGSPIWKIGLLIKKITCGLSVNSCNDAAATQIEEMEWSNFVVSDEDLYGPRGLIQGGILEPQMAKKTITRDGTAYVTEVMTFSAYNNAAVTVESGNSIRTIRRYHDGPATTNKWIINNLSTQIIEDVTNTKVTYYDYDLNGRLERKDENGIETFYTYYDTGDLETVTDANLNVTTYRDYMRGIAQEEELPNGIVFYKLVNPTGTIASKTDGKSQTTSFGYDDINRLVSIDYPIHHDVTIDWQNDRSVLTRGNYTQTKIFDGFGRITSITNDDTLTGESITVDTRYDALGNIVFKSYPNSSLGTTFTYDVLNRNIDKIHPDGSKRTRTYLLGNRVQVLDENNILTTTTSESYGNPDDAQLVKIESPENVTTNIDRNTHGMINSIEQSGVTRTYTYNQKLLLERKYDPEIGYVDYEYDAAGNMTFSWVDDTQKTEYKYDSLNRLWYIDYPDNAVDTEYVYDNNSNIEKVLNNIVHITYGFDENDNLKSELYNFNGFSYQLDYGFDSLDNLNTVTYPTGRIVVYEPDAFGRPTKALPYVSDITYYPSDQIKTLDYANGKRLEYILDPRLRIDRLSHSDTQEFVNLDYGYDDLNNVTSINDLVRSQYTRSMTYDDLNRLETVSGVWGSGSIGYDENGNIQNKSIGSDNFVYEYLGGKLDTISGSSTYSYDYDIYGNVKNNGKDIFEYDSANNLRVVSDQNGPYKYFHYDGNNQMILSETLYSKNIFIHAKSGDLYHEVDWKNKSNTDYVYVGSQLITKIKTNCDAQSNDTDGDGIPDCGEERYGLNPNDPTDANNDYDNDGLTNVEEFNAETDYFNPDSDFDGIPDGYEIDNGLDPTEDDALGDLDGDGYTNYEEYLGGSSPNGAGSLPSGGVVWRADLDGNTMGPPARDQYGNMYVITEPGTLYSIDVNGQLRWSNETENGCDGTVALGYDGTVYAGCANKQLFAFDPDGTHKWTAPEGGYIAVTPNYIYVSDYVNTCFGTKVHKLNLDGERIWTYDSNLVLGRTLVVDTDSTVYGVSNPLWPGENCVDVVTNSTLVAINYDGTTKWSKQLDGVAYSSPAIGIAGTVIVGIQQEPYDKYIAYNSDGSFQREYVMPFGSGGEANPLPSPTIGTDGSLYSFSLYPEAFSADGTLKWLSYNGAMDLNFTLSSMTLGRDGYIYAGATSGLSSIKADGSPRWRVDMYARQDVDFSTRGSPSQSEENFLLGRFSAASNDSSTAGDYCPEYVFTDVQDHIDIYGVPTGSTLLCGKGGGSTRAEVYSGSVNLPTNDWMNDFDYENSLVGLTTPSIGVDGTLYVSSLYGKLFAIANPDSRGVSHSVWPITGADLKQGRHLMSCDPNGVDTDDDSMPDCYEYRVGFDPDDPTDAEQDNDQDGLTNLGEYLNRTHPYLPDTDGDTIPDGYEVTYNLGPRSNNAHVDSDNDGVANGIEYLLGSLPDDSKSEPANGSQMWAYVKQYSIQSPVAIDSNGLINVQGMSALNFMGQEIIKKEETDPSAASTVAVMNDGTTLTIKPYGTSPRVILAENSGSSEPFMIIANADITSPLAIGDDGTIYFATADDKINAYRIENYTYVHDWSIALTGAVTAAPIVASDDTIYVATIDNKLHAISPLGSTLWSFDTSNSNYSSPAIGVNGTVYLTSSDGNLYAVNPDGTEKWVFETNSYIDGSPVIGRDEIIYFGAQNGLLYAIDATGNMTWSYDTNGQIHSSPSIGLTRKIYIANDNGVLFAITPTGVLDWSLSLGSKITTSPTIDNYGIIYVGTNDMNLHAIYSGDRTAVTAWPMSGHDHRNTHNFDSLIHPSDNPPRLEIDTPFDGEVLTEGDFVGFFASASDTEDGNLSQFVTWSSNLDGELGIGYTTTNSLSLGNHTITASVTDSSNQTVTETISVSVIDLSPVSVTLSANMESPVTDGNTISLSASLLNTSDNYEYQFRIRGMATSDSWVILQDYSSSSNAIWDTSGFNGKNRVQVRARPLGTTDVPIRSGITIWVNSTSPAEFVDINESLVSPQITGTTITFTADAQGSDSGPFEYRFEIRAPTQGSDWILLRDYSTDNVLVWDSTGFYGKNRIRVFARKSGTADKPVKSALNYWINEPNPVATALLESTQSSPQQEGTLVYLSASGTGGSGAYDYQFQVKGPSTDNTWLTIQDYSLTNTASWLTTGYIGSNKIRVRVRNAGTMDKPITAKIKNYLIQ